MRTHRDHALAEPYPRKLHLPMCIQPGPHGIREQDLSQTPQEEWSYRLSQHGIRIRTPDCRTTYETDLSEVTGWSWDALERAIWKGSGHGIGPGDIRDFIITKIWGRKLDYSQPIYCKNFEHFVGLSSYEIRRASDIALFGYSLKGIRGRPGLTPEEQKMIVDGLFALRREHQALAKHQAEEECRANADSLLDEQAGIGEEMEPVQVRG